MNIVWDHVHIRSIDPEATAQWFERMFGAQVIRTMELGKPRVDILLGGQKVFIAQVTAGDGVNPAPVTPYQGLEHIGLSVKDIDNVSAGLKAKGADFAKETHTLRPGIRVCFVRGPQGILVELLERDAKYQ